MKVDLENLEVIHSEAASTFDARINGRLSKLDYIRDGNNFVITHVGVDPEFRGQGVAGKIMEVALGYARQNLLRVIPMCSYAAHYIRNNPQHMELTDQTRGE